MFKLSNKRIAIYTANKILKRQFTVTTASTNYQFDTLFKTNHQDLPRLPIPSLDDTCTRYLRSVKHLCTSGEQYETILNEVNDFNKTVGPDLHQKVLQKRIALTIVHAERKQGGINSTWQCLKVHQK